MGRVSAFKSKRDQLELPISITDFSWLPDFSWSANVFDHRWIVCIGSKRKLESDATPRVRARPKASAMRLDDRTADREAQPQTGRFRRVEGVEHPLEHRCLQ